MEKESKGMFDNFKQAASEVFSKKEEEEQKSPNVYGAAADTTAVKPNSSPLGKDTGKKPEKSWRFQQKDDNGDDDMDNDETAYIPKGTKIKGDLSTHSNLTFAGEIEGDIESRKNVVVTGKIHGDTKCRDAEIKGASIQGNINVSQVIAFERGSSIVGNLSAGNGTIDGKVEGNMNIKEDIRICENGCVIGDISAGSISVEKGAVIKGQVNITDNGDTGGSGLSASSTFGFKGRDDTIV